MGFINSLKNKKNDIKSLKNKDTDVINTHNNLHNIDNNTTSIPSSSNTNNKPTDLKLETKQVTTSYIYETQKIVKDKKQYNKKKNILKIAKIKIIWTTISD